MANASSILIKIFPFLLTVIMLGVVAVVGFVAYQIAMDVANNTTKKMEKKNMSFSKDGLKVGVKEASAEQVGDSTQNVLMKAWNASSWPGYQSKLGWGSGSQAPVPSDYRKTALARNSSSQTSQTSQTFRPGRDPRRPSWSL